MKIACHVGFAYKEKSGRKYECTKLTSTKAIFFICIDAWLWGLPKNNVLVMRNVCNVTLNNMLHMWSKTVSKYDPEPS